jgi:C1A family cysteine protease
VHFEREAKLYNSTKLLMGVAFVGASFALGAGGYAMAKNALNFPVPSAQNLLEEERTSPEMAEFMKFMVQHGKTYASGESEMETRYGHFKDNLKKIQEHNLDEEAGFEMEINQFSDMSEQEFMQNYTGARIPQKKRMEQNLNNLFLATDPRLAVAVEDTSDLPESVNWVEAGMVTTPYDQGSCGGCWAFATASSLESLATINGVFDKVPEFSVQQLMDCDKVNYGCDGGWMMDGYAYTQKHGIELKNDYKTKYIKRKGKCYHKAEKSAFQNTGAIEEDQVSNERLKSLVAKQPVAVAMYSSSTLQHYKHGVMTEKYLKCSSTKKEVNHAVVIVGYGKVAEKEKIYGKSQKC